MRHSGRHLGEQGQQVPWTTDRPFLVPFEGHKATEKAEDTRVTSVKERALMAPAGCIPASSSQPRRAQRDGSARSGRNGSWVKAKGQ